MPSERNAPMRIARQPEENYVMSQAAEKRGGIPAMLKDTAFVWEDPLDLESELTEEERMVRNSARGFAQSYLMPRVVEA
ncbi:MAG TPA: hypothetical protein VI358_04600, partial [Pseudolabrys sp.]